MVSLSLALSLAVRAGTHARIPLLDGDREPPAELAELPAEGGDAWLRAQAERALGPAEDPRQALLTLHDWRLHERWSYEQQQALRRAEAFLGRGDLRSADAALGVAEVARSMAGTSAGEAPRLRRAWRRGWVLRRLRQFVIPATAVGLLVVLTVARRRPTGALRANPFVTGAPIRAADELFGREPLLDAVETQLRRGRSVFLRGERRIGKTSSLLCLVARWQERGLPSVFIDLEGVPSDAVLGRIRDALPGGEGVPLLAIDEVRALSRMPAADRRALQTLLEGAVAVLAGTELELADWPAIVTVPVPPLHADAVAELLRSGLRRAGLRLTPAARRLLVAESRGRPMRAQLLGLYLVERGRGRRLPLLGLRDVHAALPIAEGSWRSIQEAGQAEPPEDWAEQRALLEIHRHRRWAAALVAMVALPVPPASAATLTVAGDHLVGADDDGHVRVWSLPDLREEVRWRLEASCRDLLPDLTSPAADGAWCAAPNGLRHLSAADDWKPQARFGARSLRALVDLGVPHAVRLTGELIATDGAPAGALGATTEDAVTVGAWLIAAHPLAGRVSFWRDGERMFDLSVSGRPMALALDPGPALHVRGMDGVTRRYALLSEDLPVPVRAAVAPWGLGPAEGHLPEQVAAMARDPARRDTIWTVDGSLNPALWRPARSAGSHPAGPLSAGPDGDQEWLPLRAVYARGYLSGAEVGPRAPPPPLPEWLPHTTALLLTRTPLDPRSRASVATAARERAEMPGLWMDLALLGVCAVGIAGLVAVSRRRRRALFTRPDNPFDDPFPEDPTQGPLAALALIDEALRALPRNRVVLLGSAWAGRDGVLDVIAARLASGGLAGRPCVVHRCSLVGLTEPADLWRRLTEALGGAAQGGDLRRAGPRSLGRLLRRSPQGDVHPLLMVAGLDEVARFPAARQQLRGVLQAVPVRRLAFLATAETIGPTGEALDDSPWYNHYLVRRIPPLSLPELTGWVRGRLPRGMRMDGAALELLHRLSRGDGEVARQIALEALEAALLGGVTRLGQSHVLVGRAALEHILASTADRERGADLAGLDPHRLQARISQLQEARRAGDGSGGSRASGV